MDQITFEDFIKLDIRIGKVVSAEKVPETDKLLKLIFDIGDGQERQIISGIAEFIPDPSTLVGKEIPVLINLKPRKFKGLESQGMILAAEVDGGIVLLHPEKDIPTGSKIR